MYRTFYITVSPYVGQLFLIPLFPVQQFHFKHDTVSGSCPPSTAYMHMFWTGSTNNKFPIYLSCPCLSSVRILQGTSCSCSRINQTNYFHCQMLKFSLLYSPHDGTTSILLSVSPSPLKNILKY